MVLGIEFRVLDMFMLGKCFIDNYVFILVFSDKMVLKFRLVLILVFKCRVCRCVVVLIILLLGCLFSNIIKYGKI